MVEVVQRRWVVETGDAIAGVKLDAHVSCVVGGHAQWVYAAVAQDAPTLRIEAVSLPREIFQAVVGGDATDLGEIVHQVAGPAFPIEARKVGVSVGLNLALNFGRAG